jgi:omega-6 fatty acid desaturase (delta-12 desaturase)
MTDPAHTPFDSGRKSDRPFWRGLIEPYEHPSLFRSLLDLATSVFPYVGLMIAAYITWGDISFWITLPMALIAGAFLLRTFIVFHDCAHGSFFRSKTANLSVGRLCAFLTFQAYADWRHKHAVHHGSAGDLDRRGTGDVHTLTLDEYLERPWRARVAYRLFRNPIVMFGIGPLWALMVAPRLLAPGMRSRQRNSIVLTNIFLGLLIAFIVVFVGAMPWVLIQLPAAILAGTAGVLLFYVQHQFEDVYWESGETWSYDDAALKGSSYLQLPKVLQFFTGNIGFHHVHHLSARIPNYNLQRAHDENPIFHEVPTLSVRDGMRAVRLKLWHEDHGRLVTFAEARRLAAPAPGQWQTAATSSSPTR